MRCHGVVSIDAVNSDAPHRTGNHTTSANDPHAWLEDVEGEPQLRWARERNAAAAAVLETARFEGLRAGMLEVLNSEERIPEVVKHGGFLYNFWRDASHERGVWRRTTPESFATPDPQWDVLLDVDALGAVEGTNWVWQGVDLLPPDYRLALVRLSRGGSDAGEVREFDLESRSFVVGGFHCPESKGSCVWADSSGDLLLAARDFGPGSLTTSGYPRSVRLWRRGTPLEDATELFAADATDMGVWAVHDFTEGYERTVVARRVGFFDGDYYLLDHEWRPVRLDLPASCVPLLHRQWLLVTPREPWETGGELHAPGSLVVTELERFLAGERRFETLFTPSDATSLREVVGTRGHLVLNMLDDVKSSLEVLTHTGAGWRRRQLDLAALRRGARDEPLDVTVRAVDPEHEDSLWVNVQGFLTPTSLARVDLDAEGSASTMPLKSLPRQFDAAGLAVAQRFATSADGTRVPYFLVGRAELVGGAEQRSGREATPSPTLLYGYGGFEVSLLPVYSGAIGRSWLARGGVFVMANIRGGGEYGPRWHQAALKDRRLRAYEDFAAVARDLIARRVTTPRQLGLRGGSNGGLLIGNMLMAYPDLFAAAVCQVPLLDMKRYSHLLAGASWMAEYGDPDDPAQWEFIRTFSPYHLHVAGQRYPAVLFTTSTRDDRVHPGHARKMAAKMLAAGDDVTYFENIEGGHGGAATNAQAAYMEALAYEFLWQRLADQGSAGH